MSRRIDKITEREYDRVRKAATRSAARDQEVPKVKDKKRRAALESDDAEWLRFYLPEVFYNPFTADQVQTIEEAAQTLKYGTQKCRAMKRGGGKSSILRYLMMKYAMAGQIRFALLLCATASKAKDALSAIKKRLCALPGTPLFDDYPMICHLAKRVHSAPLRARTLTANGLPVKMEWNPESIIFPSFDDEPDGAIAMCMGITSDQLQGCNVYDVRPEWVLLDDLDSRDSLAAVDGTVADKLETIVDHNVAGLGGPGRRLGIYMNCTVPSRTSLAYRYSDPTQKPSWSGVRVPAIKQWPDARELWDQYVEMRKNGKGTFGEDRLPVDPFGRQAFRLYESKRAEMDAGAILSDTNDYNMDVLPDGSVMHLSALQKAYDYIADKDMRSFMTEWQNDPPEDQQIEVSGITPRIVASRDSGMVRRECHQDAILTAYCDTGKKAFHWIVTAWRPGCIGDVIDYGVHEVHGTDGQLSGQTLNKAILSALHDWRSQILAMNYGKPLSMALVNSAGADPKVGAWEDAVYAFCREVGHPFHPSIGIGRTFALGSDSRERKVGHHWYKSRQQKTGQWLYCLDANFWKLFCHERFLTSTSDELNPRLGGSLALFTAAIPREHHSYSQQICAEIWQEKFVEGKGLKAGFYEKSPNNHWLDGTAGCCAAADMCGITLLAPQAKRQQLSLSEMRQLAKQK